MSTSPVSSISLSVSRLANRSVSFSDQTEQRLEKGGIEMKGAEETFPIICICHLSWDWVWQRPQQFLSRFARNHRVLFVETHRSEVPKTQWRVREANGISNVTIAECHLPTTRWDEGDFIDRERRESLKTLLATDLRGKFENPVLWFYDPMAVLSFAGHLHERTIVYDCMDELSQFKGAPPELIQREQQLLKKADVVFCGGRKMREKRLPLNANCHFYGTGVDCSHFGKARQTDFAIAPEIAALPGPVLGYFGVIDERIDYDLLAKLADARPDWSIAMVGPTAKVNPADFPQRANLHWLGGRSYLDLPAITKGFSVCLMPFALNASTEYINPTKALEYMATGRPVVSTALDEVRSNFGGVARIASNHQEFIAYCESEAHAPSADRVKKGLKLSSENTWEAIASKMSLHIGEVLNASKNARSLHSSSLSPAVPGRLAYV